MPGAHIVFLGSAFSLHMGFVAQTHAMHVTVQLVRLVRPAFIVIYSDSVNLLLTCRKQPLTARHVHGLPQLMNK